MLGTKNVRYSGIFKASKKMCWYCASQNFAATILVAHIDVSLQN